MIASSLISCAARCRSVFFACVSVVTVVSWAFGINPLATDTVFASDGSPQNRSQSEYPDQHEYSGNGHGNRTHGIIGEIGLRQPLQDAGVLHNCGEQPENSHNNETGTEYQCAVWKIEPCMQACSLEVSIELSDSEPKPDQREGSPNPRHQRALCSLAVALPCEL